MTLQELFAGGTVYEVTGRGYEPRGELRFNGTTVGLPEHRALYECLLAGVLCNETAETGCWCERDGHGEADSESEGNLPEGSRSLLQNLADGDL